MNVIDVFNSVKLLIKFDTVCIDNHVFRLHYRATMVALVGFTLLVSARTFIGDPISCISDYDHPRLLDIYCWIHTTFTIPRRLEGKIGIDYIQPGVGAYEKGVDNVKHHRYYQWVCFALFFQAVCFQVPRYLWKTWDGGRIKMLVGEVNAPIVPENIRDDRKKVLVSYFIENLHLHNFYAFRFFACEILNFLNVVGQIFFIDYFLDGEFSTYGIEVVKFMSMDQDQRIDPMSRIFPTLTKCNFHQYGLSGTIETFDSLCMLPVNLVNEKIYVFLWFWFIALAIVTGLAVIYRILVFSYPQIRRRLLRARCLSPHQDIECVVSEFQIGDWLILYQLSKNMNPFVFKDLVTTLSLRLNDKNWK